MKALILIISLCFAQASFSYSPTLESLLKNGNNSSIDKNTVVSNLIIKDKTEEQVITEVKKDAYVKFVINNMFDKRSEYIQLNFTEGFNNSAMREFKQLQSSGKAKVFPNGENIDGEAFYGVLEFLFNNKSTRLLNLLKQVDINIKSNKELVNTQKVELLRKYKKYLEAIKEEKEDETIINPLKSDDPDEQTKINEVYAQKLILKDDQIKRIKLGNEFFWIIDNENVYIKFNSNHEVREMNIRTTQGEVEFVFGNYVLFGANLKLPEFINFKTTLGKSYEIKATKFSMFEDNLDAHRKRKRRYQKSITTNNHDSPLFWPEFLM